MLFKSLHIRKQLLHRVVPCFCGKENVRHLSNKRSPKLASLSQRSVVQVSGKDSEKLLQGLITNDVNLLENTNASMYSMFLNVNGRNVYDLILYKAKQESGYLIECDRGIEEEFIQLMKRYKLRSKVNFAARPDLGIHCIYDTSAINEEDESKLVGLKNFFKDPRLPQLGFRILKESSSSLLVENLNLSSTLELADSLDYKAMRCQLGISEGVTEISNGIPLEYNLVWLNGVSFSKGCYIGQELVARTHHVGVIRKRIMPLRFSSENYENIEGSVVKNVKGKNVGKIISSCGTSGLGLMRLKETLDPDGQFHIDLDGTDIEVMPVKPAWWPDLN